MKVFSYIGAGILFIISAILLVLGFLYILGSGAENSAAWLTTGIIMVVISIIFTAVAIALIFFTRRSEKKEEHQAQNVVLNVDLPGNVNMETIKCKSCGGALTSKDITLSAGAPIVTCPYCHTTYQLTEEPKW